MSELVCAVMLVNGRPAMTQRAIASFREQTYRNKRLMILDTSPQCMPNLPYNEIEQAAWGPNMGQFSIGRLRNMNNGNAAALSQCDIFAHFDSDDWSHPDRLAEQVALLQSSGAECTGYNQAVFWQETHMQFCGAYVYTGQVPRLCAVGASLMYWRKTWERVPFEDVMKGEDTRFVERVNAVSVSGITPDGTPRIICSIHGSNTSTFPLAAKEFRHAPELDRYCGCRMKLALEKGNK